MAMHGEIKIDYEMDRGEKGSVISRLKDFCCLDGENGISGSGGVGEEEDGEGEGCVLYATLKLQNVQFSRYSNQLLRFSLAHACTRPK